MSKLIATDLDGTVLPEGTFDINPEYYDVIRKLHEQGHVFVASSGRHYTSMRLLLEPVKDDVVFLCGNGTYVTCRDVPMEVNALPDDLYLSVLAEMKKAGGFVCADSPEAVWTDSPDEDFIRGMSGGYRMDLRRIPSLERLLDDQKKKDPDTDRHMLKVALHVDKDAAPLAEKIRALYGDRANIMAAGASWVDCVPPGADKGVALSRIQRELGFSREDTIAFGDNGNDIGMLRCAGESYCVANGREETKEAADHVIGDMKEDAVLKVLKEILEKG